MTLPNNHKTQFHQGSKLKKIVENSSTTIKDLLNKSGISRGTLYNFFDYEEIPRKKLTPLLEVLEVDVDTFYGFITEVKEVQQPYGLALENEALKREIELLKQQIADKDEIISLLKSKRPK